MERVTDEEAGEGGWFWNEQVGSFRPPGALYCRECGVLIQDYDHLYVRSFVRCVLSLLELTSVVGIVCWVVFFFKSLRLVLDTLKRSFFNVLFSLIDVRGRARGSAGAT